MENKQFDFHEIKTFEDACKRLGLPAEALTVESFGVASAFLQANSLYKLLVIQKAINNGVWHNEKGCCYFPYWILYSKKGIKHTKEEMEAYIKQDDFLRRQFRFKLEANMVYSGDIAHASDNSLVLIHHLGAGGEVYYEAYADKARGELQHKPYNYHYGYITDCYPATEKQKQWLRKWIKGKMKKNKR